MTATSTLADAKSWNVEVLQDGEWCETAPLLATKDEAMDHGRYLMAAWTLIDEFRVRPRSEAPLHRFVNRKLVRI